MVLTESPCGPLQLSCARIKALHTLCLFIFVLCCLRPSTKNTQSQPDFLSLAPSSSHVYPALGRHLCPGGEDCSCWEGTVTSPSCSHMCSSAKTCSLNPRCGFYRWSERVGTTSPSREKSITTKLSWDFLSQISNCDSISWMFALLVLVNSITTKV